MKDQHIATASYHDTWADKPIAAFLRPFRTTRGGVRMIRYRWVTNRGHVCDGLAFGLEADRMIGRALRHRLFSDVAILIGARNIFQARAA